MIDQLKDAVRNAPVSRYRIAKDSGGALAESERSRWLSGQSRLGQDKLEAVAKAVGAKLSIRRKRSVS